jgi:hypothetical protein
MLIVDFQWVNSMVFSTPERPPGVRHRTTEQNDFFFRRVPSSTEKMLKK